MTKVVSSPKDNYNVEAYQKRMLGILKYIDRICRQNNITYYLYYGTLLGAVRHQGFIPWDDDADIALPRSEYDRLMKALAEDDDPRYKLKSMSNDKDWCFLMARVFDTRTEMSLPYSKVLEKTHVFVDIFPLDAQPDNDSFAKIHFTYLTFLTQMARCADHKYIADYERHTTIKKILKPLAAIKGARWWAEKADRLARKRDYDDENYKYICVGCARKFEGHVTRKQLGMGVRVPFEDTELNIPSFYEEILAGKYGDWRKLPVESQRKRSHLYTVIDLAED